MCVRVRAHTHMHAPVHVCTLVRACVSLSLSFLSLLPLLFLPIFSLSLCPPLALSPSLPLPPPPPPSFPLHLPLCVSFSFSSSLPSFSPFFPSPPHLSSLPFLSLPLTLSNAIRLRQQERDGQEILLQDMTFSGCNPHCSLEPTSPPCWTHGLFTSKEAPSNTETGGTALKNGVR